MTEPTLWGVPITLLFLYFIFYSFLGWGMETIYCSIRKRRFVMRGFLLGPICPIYGVGALLMILPLSFFKDNLVVFYLVATVTLSAWEYFVGWFLETTTHVKYWDYSHIKFNLKGRITLWISLWWGVLAYIAVFHLHPWVEGLFARIPKAWQVGLATVLFVILMADTVTTIRKLALTAKLMRGLEEAAEELQLRAGEAREEFQLRADEAREEFRDRMADAREELLDRVSDAREEFRDRMADAREGFRDRVADARETRPELDEALDRLEQRYNELLSRTVHHGRRFLNRYDLESRQMGPALESAKKRWDELHRKIAQRKEQRKNIK